MKKFSVNVKVVLFLVLLFLLILPFMQDVFHLINIKPLKGAVSLPEKVRLKAKDWFSGDYQIQEEQYLNESFGFRNLFIRINNQVAFNFFKKAKANGVIIGKNNYLFEQKYLNAYYGTDFIGKDSIVHRIEKIKYIHDTLAKLNKNIILILAPGKACFYPEYLPDQHGVKKGLTNYEIYAESAKEKGIPYIDFHKYINGIKGQSKYPLYPQYGLHWSTYAMCIAADSIIRYIEKMRNMRMLHLYWNVIDIKDAKTFDYDIGDGMNILFRLKSFKMAYPRMHLQNDSIKLKPSVLVVSDSYYDNMFETEFTNAFKYNHLWYYNSQVYPESFLKSLGTYEVDLKKEIDRHDVIIIMGTDANLPNIGWGFIEETYDLFTAKNDVAFAKASFSRKLKNLRLLIKSDKGWMKEIGKKAVINKIDIDSMLTLDAIWVLQQKTK
jgi:hypothetical protein